MHWIYALLMLSAIPMITNCGQEASFAEVSQGKKGSTDSSEELDANPDESPSEEVATGEDLETGEDDGDATIGVGNDDDGKQLPSIDDLINEGKDPKEIVKITCANGEKKTLKQMITFDPPEQKCPWGTDDDPFEGNLGIKDRRVSARIEQQVALDIPSNALFCDMSLDFKAGLPEEDREKGQYMYYDDEIFLTFNDVIFAASQSYDNVFQNEEGFLIYDWNKIVGERYEWERFQPYCITMGTQEGACSIPKTQTKGYMDVALTPELVQNLAAYTGFVFDKKEDKMQLTEEQAAEKKANEKFEFGFVTIGDDNTNIDCAHSKFEFEINLQYVVVKND